MKVPSELPPAPGDKRDRNPSLEGTLKLRLDESVRKEELKKLLKERLVDCGWTSDMISHCRVMAKKKGKNNTTLDDLISLITPEGRASVPDEVKAEMLNEIRSFMLSFDEKDAAEQ